VVVAPAPRSSSCSLLVLAANLFADAVRDAFDPRMRRIVPPRMEQRVARGVARGVA
jgi:hypothetical protein